MPQWGPTITNPEWVRLDIKKVQSYIPAITVRSPQGKNGFWNGIHSSPKETQLFWSCLSFGEECRSVNFGPNFICTLLLVTICPKTHSKIPHRYRTVRGHLSTSHSCKEHFPWCTWPGVTDPGPGSPWEIWKLKLRLLLGKSVGLSCRAPIWLP